ncbi:MAG: MlaD family protein [bacterium]|nr:MlaD family protein [bacterium]MDT8366020.1 MlaD family protein [bacterium]
MKSFKTETYVGLFVLAGFLIFIWGTMQITNIGDDGGYELYAVFDNAAGLDINAPVRMVGVNIGRVKGIDITERKARVVLIIDEGRLVDRDAVVSIRSQGILGDKFVGISPGSSGDYYEKGQVITHTRAGTDLDSLMDSLQTAGTDLSAILSSLRKVIGTEEGERSMTDILQNTRNLTANLDRLTSKLDTMTTENREDIRAVIANIRQVSEDLRNDLPRLTEKFEGAADQVSSVLSDNREGVKETVEQIRRDAELLEETLESVRIIAKRIEDGEGTVGKLINEDETYTSLNETLGSLNKAMKKGEKLQVLVDIHGNYLSEVEGTKGYMVLDIKPTPDKFYRLEIIDDPEGRQTWSETATTTTTTPPGTTITTVKEEVKYEDKLKFSLELGRRFYDTVFRLGYIESSFGFGVDHFWSDDDLRLSLDVWDMDRDVNPQVRLASSFRFMDFFHIDFGAEDLVNDERNPSIFVGLGLSFVDEDLKYLLAKAPLP